MVVLDFWQSTCILKTCTYLLYNCYAFTYNCITVTKSAKFCQTVQSHHFQRVVYTDYVH